MRLLRLLFKPGFIEPNPYRKDPPMLETIRVKVEESWKAVVAFVAPLIVAAIIGLLDEAQKAVELNAEVWITSVVSAVAVWFKANRPPA